MGIEHATGRYLHSQGVLVLDEETASGNTFLGHMPSSPDVAITLKPTGGYSLPDEIEGYNEPGLQVITRGEPNDRKTPYDLIKAIYNELVGLYDVTFDPGGDDETYVIRIIANQSDPADLGRDANERCEWSQNYSFHVHNPTKNRN